MILPINHPQLTLGKNQAQILYKLKEMYKLILCPPTLMQLDKNSDKDDLVFFNRCQIWSIHDCNRCNRCNVLHVIDLSLFNCQELWGHQPPPPEAPAPRRPQPPGGPMVLIYM